MSESISIIVGISSGLGLIAADTLVAERRRIVLAGPNEKSLEAARAALDAKAPGRVEAFILDLTDTKSVNALRRKIDREARHIDRFVSDADSLSLAFPIKTSRIHHDRQMDPSRAILFLAQSVARNMVKHGGGVMLSIDRIWASDFAEAPPPLPNACVGLHVMIQYLAKQLADYHIQFNSMSPTIVLTPILNAFLKPLKRNEAPQ